MGFVSKHAERDLNLPVQRSELLDLALKDLTADPNVLAIYLGGSLAKGNHDVYSDIDLHIIVTPESLNDFILNKRKRPLNWGNVLFYEDFPPASPVVGSHFDIFVKADTWYKTAGELQTSIWLKGLKAIYDPQGILHEVFEESSKIDNQLTSEDVDFWKGKILAFIHETYSAAMRKEFSYELSNLDRIRWLIAFGWYMESEKHLDSSYGEWSKIEGDRSHLKDWQLTLLDQWDCSRNTEEILLTMADIYPEAIRLNKVLCKKAGIHENEAEFRRIIEMVL